MPYQSLPWLNIDPMAFLTALDRGTQMGLERAKLNLAAEEANRPRGGGGGGSDFNPLQQAQAQHVAEQTRELQATSADKTSSDAERRRLISIGASPEDAAAQSGFDKYMRPGALSQTPWQTLNLGNGEVVQVNKKDGTKRDVLAEREKADPVKVAKVKSLRSELQTLDRLLANPMTAVLSGDQIKVEKASKQTELDALEKELGVASGVETATPATEPVSAPSPWGGFRFSPPATNSGFRVLGVSQ